MIRRATPADAPALVAIKRALPLRDGGGGFLLGTDEAGYARLCAAADVRVAEVGGTPVALAVLLPDAVLRGSELWAKRAAIAWRGPDLLSLADGPVAYLDQLAAVPGRAHRLLGAALAARVVDDAFAAHAHLFATTVEAPIRNAAAWPWLRRAGARHVGEVDEVYPEVGPLRSAVHHLDRATWRARVQAARRAPTPATARLLALAGLA